MSGQRKMARGAWSGLLLGAFLMAGAPRGGAAQDTDPRWFAWLGCWEAVDAAQDDSMVCLRPVAGDVGVEMLSVADGTITSSQIVRADGQMHETENEGCSGWEKGEFSSDSQRVYLSTDHLCEGNVRRATSGIIAMVTPEEWIDVRATEYSGRALAGSVRYRLASIDKAEAAGLGDIGAGRTMAVRAARMRAASDLEVEDVIEAIGKVDAEAVRAWVAETERPFQVDANELVRMADAGVPPEVIDVVVAVSYPERFALNQDDEARQRAGEDTRYGEPGPWGFSRRPYFWDPFYYSGFGYPGYYGLGYGYGYGYYSPVVITVQPRNDSGVVGRVLRGRGYTRQGSSGGSSSGPSGAAGRSSSGSGSSGSAGRSSSGGSSRGSSPRTAKPRPPGR